MWRLMLGAVVAGLTLFCIYTAYITGKSGNMQGAWFFIAFALFFAIPLFVVIIKFLGQKNPVFKRFYEKLSGPKEESVRFVPHWFMMLILFTFGIIVILNIIKIVLRFVSK